MASPFSWAQLLLGEEKPEEGGDHDARQRLAARLETVKDSEGRKVWSATFGILDSLQSCCEPLSGVMISPLFWPLLFWEKLGPREGVRHDFGPFPTGWAGSLSTSSQVQP